MSRKLIASILAASLIVVPVLATSAWAQSVAAPPAAGDQQMQPQSAPQAAPKKKMKLAQKMAKPAKSKAKAPASGAPAGQQPTDQE